MSHKIPYFRNGYNYDSNEVSCECGLKCEDESLTQQHFKDDADINVILTRFGITGKLPDNIKAPTFGDFTGPESLMEALEIMREAEDAFMEMPGHVRQRFNNDPIEFMEFVDNNGNREEAIKLGLIFPPEPNKEATQE